MITNRSLGAGGNGGGFKASISTNQQELNLATWATSEGWDGAMGAEITLEAGVYIWSNNVATPALTTGSFPGGLTLIVEGYIMGKGGKGCFADTDVTASPQAGGPAISLGCNVTITGGTNGFIGGGGGGGGAGFDSEENYHMSGGGGAGGGPGGDADGTEGAPTYAGGAGGAVGASGSDGVVNTSSIHRAGIGGGAGGSAAGRVIP